MKKCNLIQILVELKSKFLEMQKPTDMEGHDGKAFTRNRSLTFSRIILLVLRVSPYGLQIRLDNFFSEIGHKEETVSKQAFSRARTNLNPDILKESFYLTARTMSGVEDLELYKNKFRLCAIDGSTVALDNAQVNKDHFGCSGSKKDAATALLSLCYDPLNNIILDGGLYPYKTSERDAMKEHLKVVEDLPLENDVKNLYLSDRGYPARELFAQFIDEGKYFLMRVRQKFNVYFDHVEREEKVSFTYNNKEYTVTVFCIILDSGEKEILVTNLEDEYLTYDEAADLYFKRWAIESKFNSLKNKLELENMSGRRPITVYQDFWAKLDMANMMAALEYDTNEKIEERTAERETKYKQTTNENRLISKFSERYIELFTNPDEEERMVLFDELIADIAKYPVEVKSNRKTERKPPRNMKFSDRVKRSLQ
jgi:hypothetical protein